MRKSGLQLGSEFTSASRGLYRIMFALMDTDGDGTISLEEFQAAHAKIFKAMDANKDGS